MQGVEQYKILIVYQWVQYNNFALFHSVCMKQSKGIIWSKCLYLSSLFSVYFGFDCRGSSLSRDLQTSLSSSNSSSFSHRSLRQYEASWETVPATCYGPSLGPPPGGESLEHFLMKASRGHAKQLSESPPLTSFNLAELYYGQAPVHISKLGHLSKQANFSHL